MSWNHSIEVAEHSIKSMAFSAIGWRERPSVGETRGRAMYALRCMFRSKTSFTIARLGRHCAFASVLIGVRRVEVDQLATFVLIVLFDEAA